MGESEKWKDVIGGGSVVVVFTSSPHPHPHPPLPNGFTSSTKIISNESVFLLKLKSDTFTKRMYPKNQQSTNIATPPLPPYLNVSTVYYVCLDVICVLYFVFVVNMSKKICKYKQKYCYNSVPLTGRTPVSQLQYLTV